MKLNFAVIGASTIGQIHCKNIFQNKQARLLYIVDLDYQLGKSLSTRFNAQYSSNVDIVLKDNNVHVVLIASTASSHFNLIKKIIKNNKIIFCEKPLSCNLRSTKKIYELVKSSKIFFGMALNRRFAKEYFSISCL